MTISVNTKVLRKHDKPFWLDRFAAETFAAEQEERLKKADETLAEMLAVEGERTVENTLKLYDEIRTLLNAVGNQSSLIENVHPKKDFREKAETVSQKVSAFYTELSLNRDVFDAISAIDLSVEDDATKHYFKKTLRSFKLSGVDRDEKTRNKVKKGIL